MSPPTPSKVPQKYLVTTANISKTWFPERTFNIGFPAVLLGSPSSFALSCLEAIVQFQKRSCWA